jgi:branched-chain amino acid transport system permease protein
MNDFLQLVGTGLMMGSTYALLAVAFVIIYKACKIFNFAQGEIMLLGGYFSWSLLGWFHLGFWPTALLSTLFAFCLGFVIERFPLRPLIGHPILSIIMVTLGLSILLRSVILITWGAVLLPYPEIFGAEPIRIGALIFSQQHVWSFVSCIGLLLFFGLFFKFTKLGLLMRAVAEDQILAKSAGTRVHKIIGLSWAIACIISAIAGIFLSAINGVSIGLADYGVKAISAALVGGLESIGGAITGGLLIGVIEVLSIVYIGHGVGEVAAYIVLVLVLIVRPYGLFGLTRIERV